MVDDFAEKYNLVLTKETQSVVTESSAGNDAIERLRSEHSDEDIFADEKLKNVAKGFVDTLIKLSGVINQQIDQNNS